MYLCNAMSKYKKHVFVCTNDREAKAACGIVRGMELINEFKELLKDHPDRASIRAQRAGCLDVCALGPALVVYPDAVFYGHVSKEDIKEIVQEHLINNRPVERLMLKF